MYNYLAVSYTHLDVYKRQNQFSTAAEFYSQGDGNFRDVLQNRRCDIIFHPEINEFDIRQFYSLVQIDGYTPMYVKACTFSVIKEHKEDVYKFLDDTVLHGKSKIISALEDRLDVYKRQNLCCVTAYSFPSLYNLQFKYNPY